MIDSLRGASHLSLSLATIAALEALRDGVGKNLLAGLANNITRAHDRVHTILEPRSHR